MRRHPLHGIPLVLGAAVLWGTTGTAQSFATPTLSSYWVGGFRLGTAALFFLIWLLVGERAALRPVALARLPWRLVAGAAASMTLYNLAFFAGVRASGVALGTALALGSGPLWAGLLQTLASRRAPAPLWWLGVGIAVTGLTLAFAGAGRTTVTPHGVALCLLSGLSYALYARLTATLVGGGGSVSVGVLTGVVFSLAALLALPCAWLLAGTPRVLPTDLAVLAWLGVVATGIAYLLFGLGLRHVSSATGVALALAEPLAAVGFALLIVGERPGGYRAGRSGGGTGGSGRAGARGARAGNRAGGRRAGGPVAVSSRGACAARDVGGVTMSGTEGERERRGDPGEAEPSPHEPPQLVLLGAIDEELTEALAGLGTVGRVAAAGEVDPARHDVVVLDARPPAHGLRGALAALATGRCLVLAIVDDGQVPIDAAPGEADPLDHADEIASLGELRLRTFRWRLARQIAYRRRPHPPFSRWSPERATLEAIADHSSDWLFIKDLEHRFVLAGESFARTVGRSRASVTGQNDLEIGSSRVSVLGDPAIDWPGFWAQDDAVLAGEAPVLEDNPDWRLFSESSRHKRTIRVPLANARGEPYGLLVCSSDVTRVVRAESELAQGRSRLDDETRARREVERAATEKMRFLAAATHDLRQPLHATGLFIESLARRLDTPAQHDVLDRIRRSTAALAALFDALLDLTRLDASLVEVATRDVALESVLAPLRDEFVAEGKAKELAVTVPTSALVVHADPVLLGRVLGNLLHNAVRYTDSGHVTLDVESLGTRCALHVRDTGPGIAPSEHDAVFGEFYRANSGASHAAQGLGLGLAICRRMSRLIGATLTLDSSPGRGATFTLQLPLGEALDVRKPPADPVPLELHGRVVVVIDDEAEIREGTAAIYRAAGCTVVQAEDVESALAALESRSCRADIVVADYHSRCGNGNGIEAIERIRRSHGAPVAGVIVTGDTAPERLREARHHDLAFLHKPATPAELLRAVAGLLDTPRRADA